MASHERVLAWAMTPAGWPVIATNLGLWVEGKRTSWHEISKAVWDGSVLSVTTSTAVEHREGYDVIADRAPDRYPLEDPGGLPHEVRLRVTSSVVHPQKFALGWVAARRVPGKDGLSWVVRYDPGIDPAAHAAETDAFLETYWKNVGGSE
ncbi:hypothetical protein [Allorhizocola rhizosphaerae]|uniref:hypothetical protein n=1 Tax=Allorhizocola rhizosphaerae TaxID=1872709 RepID=UPI000E3D0276|nr:hypothetical protein [Allorhizocola rhizosphaerae]